MSKKYKRVDAFKTSDGSVFLLEDDAVHRQFEINLRDKLNKWMESKPDIDFDIVDDLIKHRSELVTILGGDLRDLRDD